MFTNLKSGTLFAVVRVCMRGIYMERGKDARRGAAGKGRGEVITNQIMRRQKKQKRINKNPSFCLLDFMRGLSVLHLYGLLPVLFLLLAHCLRVCVPGEHTGHPFVQAS
jgi:hypothetical protein